MTTRTRMMMGGALSLMALMLAGCGSKQGNTDAASANGATATSTTTTTTTTAAHFDPCSVLTADEVAAITGDKVVKTQAIGNDCNYHTNLDDDGTQVSIYPTGGKDQMETTRSANKMLGGIGGAVSSQGDVGKDVQAAITPPAEGGAPAIGDEALWEPNDMLAVRKGDLFVQATPPIVHDTTAHHDIPMMISEADKKAIAQKLVEAVLAKLAK